MGVPSSIEHLRHRAKGEEANELDDFLRDYYTMVRDIKRFSDPRLEDSYPEANLTHPKWDILDNWRQYFWPVQ